ncbi:MAG: MFS transporter [Ruminococcus sp.]|nr:MFS transporter [Candidatus Apopatosoma intestinale]
MKVSESPRERKNTVFFGLGTIGRDMFYAFEANTLLYFLSDVLELPTALFLTVSGILSVLRIFDALNDPITGLIIDNIRSPWGKFKPAILVGGTASAFFFLILFGNVGTGAAYVVFFAAAYILWDISYGINDIAYWTLLPALTTDQKQREKIGAFARICANVGMYIVMVGWQPITSALGDTPKAWFFLASVIAVLYIVFLCFPIFFVKESRQFAEVPEEKTTLRDMWNALVHNDQLMWTTLAMALFMVGYCTTTGFAIYYMKYLFGNADLYAVLAGVCGVAQLAALVIFPVFSRKFDRRKLYGIATAMVIVGYVLFAFAEVSLALIAVAAVIIFIGQAFIQLLMLMFLADTIEYGQWKLGKRSESITFSIQPLVNKIGGALSTLLISVSLVLSGIKSDRSAVEEAASIDAGGKLVVKIAMFVIPLVFIVVGYIIYRVKYKIDEEFYGKILSDLKERGEIKETEEV